MSERMKKRPIKSGVEVKIDGNYYRVPKTKMKPLLSLIEGYKVEEEAEGSLVPWRKVAKENLGAFTEQGVALQGARLKAGFSQVELAKKLGIAQYNLSKMENGKRPIGKEMARRLGKALKMDYRLFL